MAQPSPNWLHLTAGWELAAGRPVSLQIPVKRLCLQDPPSNQFPNFRQPCHSPILRHRREVTSVTPPLKSSPGRRASQCPGATQPASPGGLRACPRWARCPWPPLRAPLSALCPVLLPGPCTPRAQLPRSSPGPTPSHPGRGRGPPPCPQASVPRGAVSICGFAPGCQLGVRRASRPPATGRAGGGCPARSARSGFPGEPRRQGPRGPRGGRPAAVPGPPSGAGGGQGAGPEEGSAGAPSGAGAWAGRGPGPGRGGSAGGGPLGGGARRGRGRGRSRTEPGRGAVPRAGPGRDRGGHPRGRGEGRGSAGGALWGGPGRGGGGGSAGAPAPGAGPGRGAVPGGGGAGEGAGPRRAPPTPAGRSPERAATAERPGGGARGGLSGPHTPGGLAGPGGAAVGVEVGAPALGRAGEGGRAGSRGPRLPAPRCPRTRKPGSPAPARAGQARPSLPVRARNSCGVFPGRTGAPLPEGPGVPGGGSAFRGGRRASVAKEGSGQGLLGRARAPPTRPQVPRGHSSAWFKMGSQVSVDMGAVRVVIVGGGFGGIAAASQLQTLNIPFMLVDMKDSFHHNVAALRASVESGFAKKTFISYSVTFKENFRQGLVVEIDVQNRMVLLEDGEALPFSHLILATGSTGLFPGKFNQVSSRELAIQAYEDMVKQVQRSQSVVVVGGGSAGVEMAAEVKTEFPEKEVTLIHSQVALADKELLPCVRQEAKEILLQKGVQLLLSERVSNLEDLPLNEYRERIQVHTDKGTEVATNLVIVCNGIKVNSSAYHSAFDDHLASNGALRVNEYLQVEGYSHIYAIGDCADVKEPKMAYHAGLHASVAVANIVNSRKQRPLKAYKPGALTFLLAMGRNDGVGQISGFYVGRLMVRLAKSRDLFVSSSWKTMRQSPP